MIKRAYQEEHEFDEDAMPCPCTVCGGWFDLEDGSEHPRKKGHVICDGCAHNIEQEIEREEEIQECLDSISDAKLTINENIKRLEELGYNPPENIKE